MRVDSSVQRERTWRAGASGPRRWRTFRAAALLAPLLLGPPTAAIEALPAAISPGPGTRFAQETPRLADVYLHDGTRLRGLVTLNENELALQNAAGVLRLARDQVERVEWAEDTGAAPHSSDPAADSSEAARDVDTPTTQPGALAAPVLLNERQINRLKLAELPSSGPPERVRVRFVKSAAEPDLEQLVLAELAGKPELDDARRVFKTAEPHEKVQFVLRATGLKFADRMEIRGDPASFAQFRREVLPLVLRGCARSGCHSGSNSEAFRLPNGPTDSEAFAYTTFAVLDATAARQGPLIDRDAPARSTLLAYLLPPSDDVPPHPPTIRGRVTPMLRGVSDPRAAALRTWIESLRRPRPDYGLEAIAGQ